MKYLKDLRALYKYKGWLLLFPDTGCYSGVWSPMTQWLITLLATGPRVVISHFICPSLWSLVGRGRGGCESHEDPKLGTVS